MRLIMVGKLHKAISFGKFGDIISDNFGTESRGVSTSKKL